jgi:hypothetical protein
MVVQHQELMDLVLCVLVGRDEGGQHVYVSLLLSAAQQELQHHRHRQSAHMMIVTMQ